MKKQILNVALVAVLLTCVAAIIVVYILQIENQELSRENEQLQQELNVNGNTEIHQCWLCGGIARILPVNDRFYIKCQNCELETDYFNSKIELIRYWNKENGN